MGQTSLVGIFPIGERPVPTHVRLNGRDAGSPDAVRRLSGADIGTTNDAGCYDRQQTYCAQFIAVVPKELVNEARSHCHLPSALLSDCAMSLLLASGAAIVKTDTATLEAALVGTPQVTVTTLL
jgi:hypothetical protein